MHALTPLAAANPAIHAFDGGALALLQGHRLVQSVYALDAAEEPACVVLVARGWIIGNLAVAQLPRACKPAHPRCCPALRPSRCQALAHCVHSPTGPTLFLDALWLPYRRDPAVLEAALATASCSPVPLRAVFAHADIVSGQGQGGSATI